jgi:hypothetical protein
MTIFRFVRRPKYVSNSEFFKMIVNMTKFHGEGLSALPIPQAGEPPLEAYA